MAKNLCEKKGIKEDKVAKKKHQFFCEKCKLASPKKERLCKPVKAK
jgi:hypothetical protein